MPVGRQLQLRTTRMDVPRLLSTDCACTSMMPTLQEPHSAFHRLSRCGKRIACPLLLWFYQTDRKKSVVPRPSSSAGAARPSTRSQESPASRPRESVGVRQGHTFWASLLGLVAARGQTGVKVLKCICHGLSYQPKACNTRVPLLRQHALQCSWSHGTSGARLELHERPMGGKSGLIGALEL